MEDKLDLIILQNWILLGLLVVLWATTSICNFFNFKQREPKEPKLGNLWETDQIDKLLDETDEILDKFPNREDALYFRGKALRRIGKDSEAIYYFERLKEVAPAFGNEADRQISDIKAANK